MRSRKEAWLKSRAPHRRTLAPMPCSRCSRERKPVPRPTLSYSWSYSCVLSLGTRGPRNLNARGPSRLTRRGLGAQRAVEGRLELLVQDGAHAMGLGLPEREGRALVHVGFLGHLELDRVHAFGGTPVGARDVAALEAPVQHRAEETF